LESDSQTTPFHAAVLVSPALASFSEKMRKIDLTIVILAFGLGGGNLLSLEGIGSNVLRQT